MHGQLGEHELAHKAVQDLLALQPDFTSVALDFYPKWLRRNSLSA